jgi:2,3-bisphosphoglycerate-independent phosphoglycerate mutase
MTKEMRDWRELCAAIAQEQDQTKLLSLMEQLLEVLEDHERSRSAAGQENANADWVRGFTRRLSLLRRFATRSKCSNAANGNSVSWHRWADVEWFDEE